jgi:UDP-glucose 4-epimerase
MSVLVTGGAGYIGSHMAHELVDRGEAVVVLDNLSTGFRTAIPQSASFVQGDVGDEALVRRVVADHGVRAIIHFAGSIVVPESVADPVGYYRNNTVNSLNLINAAAESGVGHFIFSSTAAVYGDPDEVPVREDAPLRPLSPYGRSKLMTEWMLQDAVVAYPSLSFAALRYFNVAGADPSQRTGQSTANATHLIKVAVQAAIGRRDGMQVFGVDYPTPDGTCIRDYIHVGDLARAHVEMLDYLRAGGRSTVANCGYGHGFSVFEVIDVVKRISGVDFPVAIAPRRAGDPSRIVACSDRLRSLTNWRPRFDDLDAIVRHALAWEKTLLPDLQGSPGASSAAGPAPAFGSKP